jgi:hypothetical protein
MPSLRSAWELNRQIMRQNGYEPKAEKPSSNSGTPTNTPKQPDRSAKNTIISWKFLQSRPSNRKSSVGLLFLFKQFPRVPIRYLEAETGVSADEEKFP